MSWFTTFDDEVTAGDVVALSILGSPDVVGFIVGPGAEGRVSCLLNNGSRGSPSALEVEAHQLRMLVRRGGSSSVALSTQHSARPA